MLDEAGQWDLGLVDAIAKHEVKHFAEVWAIIAEDILHISDDVLFGQVASFLDKLGHQLLLQLLLIRIVVEEPLKDGEVLSIVLGFDTCTCGV